MEEFNIKHSEVLEWIKRFEPRIKPCPEGNCPLEQFILDRGDIAFVAVNRTNININDETFLLPVWASHFVLKIDKLASKKVSHRSVVLSWGELSATEIESILMECDYGV